jgi:hypothetical protein
MRPAAVTLVVVILVAGGLAAVAFGRADTAPRAERATAAVTYAMAPTRRCLVKLGAVVGRVRASDARLRALRDLAQRNSFQAMLGGRTVAMAFGRDVAAAQLLVELLTVPRDPYRLTRRANVVFLYRPRSRQAFSRAASCLR